MTKKALRKIVRNMFINGFLCGSNAALAWTSLRLGEYELAAFAAFAAFFIGFVAWLANNYECGRLEA